MTSPLSIFLRELRLRAGLTQLQMGALLGYEQAYMSSLELGVKSPSNEFLAKLMAALDLNQRDCEELESAVKQSNRRFTLPPEVSTQAYVFCNALWEKIEHLYPAQIAAMSQLLKMDEQMRERPRYTPVRLRRRSNKVEADM